MMMILPGIRLSELPVRGTSYDGAAIEIRRLANLSDVVRRYGKECDGASFKERFVTDGTQGQASFRWEARMEGDGAKDDVLLNKIQEELHDTVKTEVIPAEEIRGEGGYDIKWTDGKGSYVFSFSYCVQLYEDRKPLKKGEERC